MKEIGLTASTPNLDNETQDFLLSSQDLYKSKDFNPVFIHENIFDVPSRVFHQRT